MNDFTPEEYDSLITALKAIAKQHGCDGANARDKACKKLNSLIEKCIKLKERAEKKRNGPKPRPVPPPV